MTERTCQKVEVVFLMISLKILYYEKYQIRFAVVLVFVHEKILKLLFEFL